MSHVKAWIVAVALLTASQATAFNEDYHSAAGIVVGAQSQQATATGLRGMAAAAETSDNPNGPFIAGVLRVQAMPRGIGHAVDKLVDTARDPARLTSPDDYAQALAPLLGEIVDTATVAEVDSETLTRLGEALAKLDDAATQNGLPGLDKVIDKVFGTSGTGGRIKRLLKALVGVARAPDGSKSASEARRDLRDAQISAILGLVPPGLKPYAPIERMAAAIPEWSAEVMDIESEAIGLVTDAMRTGRFDEAAFEGIRERLIEKISRGPWDIETFKDMILNWCKEVPELGEYCTAIFREAKNAVNIPACRAIDCDCGSVRGVVAYIYQQECRAHQREALLQCALAQRVVTGCRHPFGPAASPIE